MNSDLNPVSRLQMNQVDDKNAAAEASNAAFVFSTRNTSFFRNGPAMTRLRMISIPLISASARILNMLKPDSIALTTAGDQISAIAFR